MLKNCTVTLTFIACCFYSGVVLAEEQGRQEGTDGTTSGLSSEFHTFSDGDKSEKEKTSHFLDLVKKGYSHSFRGLLFVDEQYPSHSTQNPENAFLNLYRYSTELHLRPDFFFDLPYASGMFKPRLTSSYRWWEDGIPKGETDGQSRVFVNEWVAKIKPHPNVFLSYGKEKLLWGPAFLANPSDIFFSNIEKINPLAELEGKYFSRLVYVPNNTLTFTLINNTRDGENQQETFRPTDALKTEIMGTDYLVGIIGYFQRDDRFRLGSFGQWTASDAILLYYDGIVTKGTDALYPEPNPSLPFGAEFVKKFDDSKKLFTTVVTGGSYTFLSGATVTLEFLYNGEGYSDAEAREYYNLRKNASDHFFDTGGLSGLSRETLSQALNTGLQFLRRYYIFIQYQKREIKDVLDIILRYTHGIEENAGVASTIIELRLTDTVQFVNINTISIDHGRNTEFNSILEKSFTAGIEVHF